MADEGHPRDAHQGLGHVAARSCEARPAAGRENHCLQDSGGTVHSPILIRGTPLRVRATFQNLTHTSDPARAGAAPGADAAISSTDRFERDTVSILKRLSRRPIEPAPESELLADLGFDSLQVLELVGELEDHFDIAVPLNSLTHIRTVGQIAAEVRRLVADQDAPHP